MSEDKKDILKALDEMELKSNEINARKKKVEERIKRVAKPKVEPTREEKIQKRKEEQDIQESFTTRAYLVKTGILSMIALVVCWVQAKGDLVDFVRNVIIAICFYGFYLMKISR